MHPLHEELHVPESLHDPFKQLGRCTSIVPNTPYPVAHSPISDFSALVFGSAPLTFAPSTDSLCSAATLSLVHT